MGSGALQITISLFAILGAAGLALVCDYLRHRNEELKATMVAMGAGRGTVAPSTAAAPFAKQRQRQPQSQPMEAVPEPVVTEAEAAVQAVPEAATPSAIPAIQAIETQSRRPRRRRPVETEDADLVRRTTRAEMEVDRAAFIERAMSVASEKAAREEPSNQTGEPPVVADVVPVMQQMSTDSAMKDWLSRRAVARMSAQNAAPVAVMAQESEAVQLPPPEPIFRPMPLVAPKPNALSMAAPMMAVRMELPIADVIVPSWASVPVIVPGPAAASIAVVMPIAAAEPVSKSAHVDHRLWASLFQDEPKLVLVNRKERPAAREANEVTVPAGVQDNAMLSRMLGSSEPYTGLVICISVNDLDERVINQTITNFLTELTRPGDMLCRSSRDEFILLCPNERGSDSRRRLGAISQQLWDYQLRNLSNFSVLFSWGSEEAWRARLSDALDAARDSMSLTRRTREQQTEQASSAARRKAV